MRYLSGARSHPILGQTSITPTMQPCLDPPMLVGGHQQTLGIQHRLVTPYRTAVVSFPVTMSLLQYSSLNTCVR